jgi:hypothetical protein
MSSLPQQQKKIQSLVKLCDRHALASVDVVLEILYLFWFVIKMNNIPEANLHYKCLVYHKQVSWLSLLL